ncbi:MAG: 16S rRNA (cytidine(1402)-2'-O)-methyltransferase [Bacilli bacterium]|nr:16S rRNA (cytidine(1402)-2'-O)-methyltransferase [Bacilli bacterium]MDY6430245.1 16S rRNA (cytidine(1402)-2'-O)-methyltransferase [Bacilli bacterium]
MIKRDSIFSSTKPILFLIATPIGNLEEFSPRAISTIKQMDYIACEDTRNTGKLLSLFNLSKPLISCHEHNEIEASSHIISLLKQGKKVAYVSDAGYPTLSDPGEKLVKACLDNDINVSTINGPSAAINALSLSGLDSSHFYFEGFLPQKTSLQEKDLLDLATRKETLIIYESPHRIQKTLQILAKYLGSRKAVICRELTKIHEEIIRGDLLELSKIDEKTLIGEMVIVIEGKKEQTKEVSEEEITAYLKQELAKEKKSKDIVNSATILFSSNKNYIYSLLLKIKED